MATGGLSGGDRTVNFSAAIDGISRHGSRGGLRRRVATTNAVLDRELVIADEQGTADFGALQERLTFSRGSAGDADRIRPAVVLVFDILELGGDELVLQTLDERRPVLEQFLNEVRPPAPGRAWRPSMESGVQ
jgi:bifunctional non-homologous end joining protein LigD